MDPIIELIIEMLSINIIAQTPEDYRRRILLSGHGKTGKTYIINELLNFQGN